MVAYPAAPAAQPTPILQRNGTAPVGRHLLATELNDDVNNGGVKRLSRSPLVSTSSSPSVIPAPKRQRSVQGTRVEDMKILTTPIKQENAFHGPAGPPTADAMKASPPDSFNSSQPMKATLKSSLKVPATNALVAGLDSPSESDRRGMYSDYVNKALNDHARGKTSTYDELVSQFKLPSARSTTALPPVGLLQMLLHSLSNTASKLDRRNHTALVHAILTLPWATMGGDTFARTWTRFVCNLCSVRSEWVSEVLVRSIKGLSYRSDWRSVAYAPTTSSARPTRRLIYARIHALLKTLLSLIPTLPTQLAPLVLRHFPHKGESTNAHIVYVQNIFEVCEYAPELQHGILESVIGRCLEIDVEVQMELDDLEEAEANFQEQGLLADKDNLDGFKDSDEKAEALDILDKPLDDDSGSSGEDSDSESGDGSGFSDIESDFSDEDDNLVDERSKTTTNAMHNPKRVKQVRGLVDKLDALMSAVFRHLEQQDNKYNLVSKGMAQMDMAPARAISLRNEQFTALLHIFTRSLLPTFKSRHVQFLLFWFSSLDRDFSDMFLGMLLGKAIYSGTSHDDSESLGQAGDDEDSGDLTNNDGTPIILRIAASSYIASLVSRASYISTGDVRSVMQNLVAFLDAHLDYYSSGGFTGFDQNDLGSVNGPHALFYAICQACLYIFCFRWRDLQTSAARPREESEELSGHGTDHEDDDDDDEERNGMIPSAQWCEGMDVIKRAIMSRLNPLAHCSSTVVQQFAGVAQLTGFLYCWSIIESNSRNAKRISRTGSANSSMPGTPTKEMPAPTADALRKHVGLVGAYNANDTALPPPPPSVAAQRQEIDSFFPFDPFRLRSSTKWIEPLYREWSDVAPEGMLDDDETEDDDDETDDQDESAYNDSDSDDDKSMANGSAEMSGAAGLAIPGVSMHRAASRGANASKGFLSPPLPARHSRQPLPGMAASASTNNDDISTDASSSVAQSLDAMSISPRFAAGRST